MNMKTKTTFALLAGLAGATFVSALAARDKTPVVTAIYSNLDLPGNDLEVLPVVIVLIYLFQTLASFLRYELIYSVIDALPGAFFVLHWIHGNTDVEDETLFNGFLQNSAVAIIAMSYFLIANIFPPAIVQGGVLFYFVNNRDATTDAAEAEFLSTLWTGAVIFKGIFIVVLNAAIYNYGWDIFSYAKLGSVERLQAIVKSAGVLSGIFGTFNNLSVGLLPLFYIFMAMSYRPEISSL